MEIDIEKLNNALRNGVVAFTFIKISGETRKAIGTKNLSLIGKVYGEKHLPKSGLDYRNDNTIRYFDIEKQEWRQFYKSSVISVENWDVQEY